MSELEVVEISDNDLVEEPDIFELIDSGSRGPAGPGLPKGGLIGQFVQKTSSVLDYATEWVTLTKAVVGLGNVTDDAQLKRADDDYGDYSFRSSPQTSDNFLIELFDGTKYKITFITFYNFLLQLLSSIFQPISGVTDLGTITENFTLNFTNKSDYVGGGSTSVQITLDGITGSRQSAMLKFTPSAQLTFSLESTPIYVFMTTQNLTNLTSGVLYHVLFKSFDSGPNVEVYVRAQA